MLSVKRLDDWVQRYIKTYLYLCFSRPIAGYINFCPDALSPFAAQSTFNMVEVRRAMFRLLVGIHGLVKVEHMDNLYARREHARLLLLPRKNYCLTGVI